MRGKISRALAMRFACPKCGASQNTPCVGKKRPRKAPHQLRYENARMDGRVEVLVNLPWRRPDSAAPVPFYQSDAWREVRYRALKREGGACQCCGARAQPGKPLHVDHIRPRSKFPALALEISNLQVLCADCNLGKRDWDQTDWRSA